jgi:hypothetical protein
MSTFVSFLHDVEKEYGDLFLSADNFSDLKNEIIIFLEVKKQNTAEIKSVNKMYSKSGLFIQYHKARLNIHVNTFKVITN